MQLLYYSPFLIPSGHYDGGDTSPGYRFAIDRPQGKASWYQLYIYEQKLDMFSNEKS